MAVDNDLEEWARLCVGKHILAWARTWVYMHILASTVQQKLDYINKAFLSTFLIARYTLVCMIRFCGGIYVNCVWRRLSPALAFSFTWLFHTSMTVELAVAIEIIFIFEMPSCLIYKTLVYYSWILQLHKNDKLEIFIPKILKKVED